MEAPKRFLFFHIPPHVTPYLLRGQLFMQNKMAFPALWAGMTRRHLHSLNARDLLLD